MVDGYPHYFGSSSGKLKQPDYRLTCPVTPWVCDHSLPARHLQSSPYRWPWLWELLFVALYRVLGVASDPRTSVVAVENLDADIADGLDEMEVFVIAVFDRLRTREGYAECGPNAIIQIRVVLVSVSYSVHTQVLHGIFVAGDEVRKISSLMAWLSRLR